MSKASADAQAYALKKQQLLEKAARLKEERKSGVRSEQRSSSVTPRQETRTQEYQEEEPEYERQPSARGRGSTYSNSPRDYEEEPQMNYSNSRNNMNGGYSNGSGGYSNSNSSYGIADAMSDPQARGRGPLVKKLPWETNNRKSAPPRQLEPLEYSRSNSQENVFEDQDQASKLAILKAKRTSSKITSSNSNSSSNSNYASSNSSSMQSPKHKPQARHYQDEYDEPQYEDEEPQYQPQRTQQKQVQQRQPPPQQMQKPRQRMQEEQYEEPRYEEPPRQQNNRNRMQQEPRQEQRQEQRQEPRQEQRQEPRKVANRRDEPDVPMSNQRQTQQPARGRPAPQETRSNGRSTQKQPPPEEYHEPEPDPYDIPIAVAKKSAAAAAPPAFASNANMDLVECGICGRRFASDRIEKHEGACQKSNKQRKVFDSTKNRVEGTEAEKFVLKKKPPAKNANRSENSGDMPSNKIPKWKRDRLAFINAIRAARGEAPEKAEAVYDADGQEVEMEVDDGLVPCQYCGRRFNETAQQRHVKICQSVFMKKGGKPVPQKAAASPAMNRTQAEPKAAPAKKAAPAQQLSKTSAFPGGGSGGGGSSNNNNGNRNMNATMMSPKAAPVKAALTTSPSVAKAPAQSRIGATTKAAEENMVACPHCARRFDKYSADRHIGICQKIFTKPKAAQGAAPAKGVAKPIKR